ncbi:hypothetical protein [Actinoplanes sp. NPDC051411]|uniref:hypothetical protein n=1 Tax=Actinoplanes sp. NPDC051411 TaxID=3155522 RepID=UPI0034350481
MVPAIASALSAQGSELIVAGGKTLLKSVCDVIRARFGTGTPEAASLDAALRHPGEPAAVNALAEALSRVMASDPRFARQTLEAWQSVSASGDGVVNHFSGQASQVVQAKTIRGGIRF